MREANGLLLFLMELEFINFSRKIGTATTDTVEWGKEMDCTTADCNGFQTIFKFSSS